MKARVTALALALTVVGASTAAAASITINTSVGTSYTTSGITDHSAYSNQMNGMTVTAYWTVGGGAQQTQTAVWNDGVTFTGSSFDLHVIGDTFDPNAWTLDFNVGSWQEGRLQSLVFNGVPGNTVFDRTTSPSMGTAGSDWGRDVSGFADYCDTYVLFFGCVNEGDITATYFNQVTLGGNPFVGDIYAGLKIDFLSDGGLNEDFNWRFSLDTDIATTSLVNEPAQVVTPEPASMVLFGTGLLGFVAIARRRARRS